MPKKPKSIIAFSDVGNDNNQPENNTDVKVNTNVNTNVSTNLDEYYSDPDKIVKKQVSIYLDVDVIEALNKFGKLKGKGAKSELVNNFLKKSFNIRQN